MSGQRDIRLLLADVDGTLVTQDSNSSDEVKAQASALTGAEVYSAPGRRMTLVTGVWLYGAPADADVSSRRSE